MSAPIDPVDLLEELLGIDSVNPAMGGPGERVLAEHLAKILQDIGCRVSLLEGASSPERPNLVAVLPGTMPRPTLLLEAHLDTVAQPRIPIKLRREGGRLYGRGACDTKGSIAAMVAALSRLISRSDRPTVVFAGAADEEVAMTGARALLGQLPPVDAAIVGEPTSLSPVRVHNGMLRFRIVARGTAAHTSRAHLGVNAIAAAARAVLAIQDQLVPALQARPAHPLAGPALATAAVIRGGVAPNLVPEWCEVDVDRRLAPGEDPADALAEVDALLEPLRAAGDAIVREEPRILLPAVETPADHLLVRTVEATVTRVTGRSVTAGGVPYGTDASYLSGSGGIPCVILGPGSIDQAHTDDEWVPIREVRQAARILEETVLGYA
jgi:acetylornithine deacetylase/succinyl-diaminopimelate desuccinylase-like protein